MIKGHLPVVSANSLQSFFDAADQFFSSLTEIRWTTLLIGLLFFLANLALRSRAWFHTLRAAYPAERFQWRRIWGAYMAAVGFNNVVPVRGGDVIKLFLVKNSVPNSSYPAVASSFFVESIFDTAIGVLVLLFAFTQGVFPKPPDFSKLPAFDLSFFAGHPRFTLFLLTALAIGALVGFAVLSARMKAFWARVRQGLTILKDRRRWVREVVAIQAVAWLCRAASFWFMLEAFHIGGSVRNVLLVFGSLAVAGMVPFTPGGAGVQQALLVKVFGSGAAAYSVGQQVAIAATTFGLGFLALIFIFGFRSFKEVIALGKAERAAEAARKAPAAVR